MKSLFYVPFEPIKEVAQGSPDLGPGGLRHDPTEQPWRLKAAVGEESRRRQPACSVEFEKLVQCPAANSYGLHGFKGSGLTAKGPESFEEVLVSVRQLAIMITGVE